MLCRHPPRESKATVVSCVVMQAPGPRLSARHRCRHYCRWAASQPPALPCRLPGAVLDAGLSHTPAPPMNPMTHGIVINLGRHFIFDQFVSNQIGPVSTDVVSSSSVNCCLVPGGQTKGSRSPLCSLHQVASMLHTALSYKVAKLQSII